MTSSLPSFVIGGSAKCGTNSLRAYLADHPDIYMPDHELRFFNTRYHLGSDWYRSQFSRRKGEKAVGEVTSHYFYTSGVARRMFDTIPRSKVIFSLRNPIARAYSHYWMRVHKGEENRRFSDIVRQEYNQGPKEGGYIAIGHHHKHLCNYLKYFPKDRIHCMIFEDFANAPLTEVQKIYGFIGVDTDYVPPRINRIYNTNKDFRIRSRILLNCLFALKRANGMVTKSFPEQVSRTERFNEALSRFHIRMNTVPGTLPEMDASTRSAIRRLYRTDIENLEKLLDKDLTHWR